MEQGQNDLGEVLRRSETFWSQSAVCFTRVINDSFVIINDKVQVQDTYLKHQFSHGFIHMRNLKISLSNLEPLAKNTFSNEKRG